MRSLKAKLCTCLTVLAIGSLTPIFSEPSFEQPTSQLATENQFYSPEFAYWSKQIKDNVRFHRKLWEYCYVAQVLRQHGKLEPGRKGLGFAVGQEPLPALFAKFGCNITATDQDFLSAMQQGWASTDQHTSEKSKLNQLQICPEDQFDQLVDMRVVDMTNIDPDLKDYDFVWSCCSFEHLGSINAGLTFVLESVKCLKKGGIAVHTTEYNISSSEKTVSSGPTVIFRKKDMLKLKAELEKMGCFVYPFNFDAGSGELDKYVDYPPYSSNSHIKLGLSNFVTTSVGIIIIKQ